ncbi:MAG: hypothetical protein VB118_04825 [Oscillospiraceae bacterium]|nr:hypothetical protein [Oscillospiraceae bacterium]
MAFSRPQNNLSTFRSMPDVISGSASTLKALLDDLHNANANELITLICELEAATGAGKIGASVQGIDGNNIQALLASLNIKIDEITQGLIVGAIPDGSLSESMLAAALADKINSAIAVSNAYLIFKTAGSASFTVPRTGYYKVRLQGAGGGGTLNTSYFVSNATYECAGGPSGAYCEAILHLIKDDIIPLSIGEGGEGAGNSFFTLDGTTSVSNFNTIYKNTTLHNSPGGATTFGSGENIITAPGGSRLTSSPMPSAAGLYSSALMLVKAGMICADNSYVSGIENGYSYAGQALYRGAESFSGNGADISGTSIISPGFGGGGLGGRWYFDGSTTMTFRRQSGKGGNGLIVIEYVQ